jgi:hypothetical protein
MSRYIAKIWEEMLGGSQDFMVNLNAAEGKKSWYFFISLRNESDLPWICAWYYNEVLSEEEHFGSNERA